MNCVTLGVGSSPRGRGKPTQAERFFGNRRLIPAWAGKTRRDRVAHAHHWAHPRVGGENHPGELTPNAGARLILAWAGKTLLSMLYAHAVPAHPRVGGENRAAMAQLDAAGGSSPRGRGKLGHIPSLNCPDRLIPAWAGKTNASPRRHARKTAHPRVGGENQPSRKVKTMAPGSSPRGRGKLSHYKNLDFLLRLIPAWAGKT